MVTFHYSYFYRSWLYWTITAVEPKLQQKDYCFVSLLQDSRLKSSIFSVVYFYFSGHQVAETLLSPGTSPSNMSCTVCSFSEPLLHLIVQRKNDQSVLKLGLQTFPYLESHFNWEFFSWSTSPPICHKNHLLSCSCDNKHPRVDTETP